MTAIASAPGALRLFALSIVARVPLTMLSIALLIHAQHQTGSFAAAGVVAGTYAMVDRAAPEGTATEAFAWLATAVAIGASSGSVMAGALADGAGPAAAFALAGGAGAVALLATALRSSTLAEAPALSAA